MNLENDYFPVDEIEMKLKQNIDKNNITIFTSDVCGLGKTFKIKKLIEEKNQRYFHLLIGGILTKNNISRKLTNLLNKIKEEESNNKLSKNIRYAIHLDLTESEEISIMNEFLFSFLITKFYTNNETIIYIPKDIEIYIEIPNCFKNYLSQFGILNIFPKKNISLNEIPKLHLPKQTIDNFKLMLDLNTNKDIEEKFLKKYMDNSKKYSYHQIIIIIKLFISQYGKFNSLKIIDKNGNISIKKDIKEKFINDFFKNINYTVNNGFQKLLIENIDENKMKKNGKNYIDLLSEIYDNDMKNLKLNIPLNLFINDGKSVDFLKNITEISKVNNNKIELLLQLKQILNIPNDIEKDLDIDTEVSKLKQKSLISILNYKTDNYIITSDNFKKIIFIYHLINADIPVILMGEAGCGKTLSIIKLNQILNNGEILVEKINIHPGITDEYINQKIKQLNEKAKKQKNELWIFFDEINTCLSMSLLTEIFINKTFNGEKLNDNIRLIGACNPYKKKKRI